MGFGSFPRRCGLVVHPPPSSGQGEPEAGGALQMRAGWHNQAGGERLATG